MRLINQYIGINIPKMSVFSTKVQKEWTKWGVVEMSIIGRLLKTSAPKCCSYHTIFRIFDKNFVIWHYLR